MTQVTNMFSFAPLLLITHCIFIFVFKRWLGPIGTFYGACLNFGLVLCLSLSELLKSLQNGAYHYVDYGRWFYCLDIIDSHLVFCVDSLASIASAVVLTLTVFALYFGVEYMYRDAFINRLLYLLNLFATSVVFLFFCYDYFLIIFAWECIGLFSFLLVNFYSTRIYTIKAALKTFVFSRISDMFMFISFSLSLVVFNTTDLSLIFMQSPFLMFHYLFIGDTSFHFLTFFATTLVLSGGIKAAQFFSHVWLPDAMEAPTPASALIHSSTLVVAGVFLIIRFAVVFEFTLMTNYILILLGAVTLSFGAITATFQQDIKKLVAYSTISQIGYLVCGCGFCCYEEVLLYLIIHALNKAFLFVLVGYTVHFFAGNTDLRQMGGLYIYSFDLTIFFFGVCVNLAGVPYSAGFIGKELLLFQVLRDEFISLLVRGCWLVSFFFTPIYMLMLLFLALFGPKKSSVATYITYWGLKLKDYWFLHYRRFNLNYWSKLGPFTNDSAFWIMSGYSPSFCGFAYANNLPIVRFQVTSVTSRLTVHVLATFWTAVLFFGNTLLSVLLNYNTLSETIFSSSFTTIKQHVIYTTLTSSMWLSGTIFFYILTLTIFSLSFLSNMRHTFTYNYFYAVYLFDLLVLLSVFLAWIF